MKKITNKIRINNNCAQLIFKKIQKKNRKFKQSKFNKQNKNNLHHNKINYKRFSNSTEN